MKGLGLGLNIFFIPTFIHNGTKRIGSFGTRVNTVSRWNFKFHATQNKRLQTRCTGFDPTMTYCRQYATFHHEQVRCRHEDTDQQRVQDMLYRIRECNRIPSRVQENLIDFVVDHRRVGKVTTPVAEILCNSSPISPVFVMDRSDSDTPVLTLAPTAGTTVEQRTESVMSVMKVLKEKGIVSGWRNELYPLSDSFYNEPLLFVERAAAPFLGMLQYGVHINGLVKSDDTGEEKMWIARRSATKSLYPGMTDQLVAGGQPAGLSLMENVFKECQEEAGIPIELAMKGITAVGAVSYENVNELSNGLDVVTRAVLFNFDLELPHDFEPTIVDGEVEEFFQWTVEEQFASLSKSFHDPMKPNCYLCVIDYLLRKGEISPDVPGYLDVLRELRNGDCK